MAMNSYTELFFLDEAAAFVAGHRPCAERSRDRYWAYQAAWAAGVLGWPGAPVRASEMDAALHAAQVDETGQQRRWQSSISGLPDGTFVLLNDAANVSWLDWQGTFHAIHRRAPCRCGPLSTGRRARYLPHSWPIRCQGPALYRTYI